MKEAAIGEANLGARRTDEIIAIGLVRPALVCPALVCPVVLIVEGQHPCFTVDQRFVLGQETGFADKPACLAASVIKDLPVKLPSALKKIPQFID